MIPCFLTDATRANGHLEWVCRWCRNKHSVPEDRGVWGGPTILFLGATPCASERALDAEGKRKHQALRVVE